MFSPCGFVSLRFGSLSLWHFAIRMVSGFDMRTKCRGETDWREPHPRPCLGKKATPQLSRNSRTEGNHKQKFPKWGQLWHHPFCKSPVFGNPAASSHSGKPFERVLAIFFATPDTGNPHNYKKTPEEKAAAFQTKGPGPGSTAEPRPHPRRAWRT